MSLIYVYYTFINVIILNMKRSDQGNVRYFKKIDTKNKAYFLGFIAADGCIQEFTKTSVGLSITLNVKDKVILDKLKEEIGNEHTIRVWSYPQTFNKSVITTFCRFQLCNKKLVDDIKGYGILERKSLTIGNIIKNIPIKFRKSFILGYFDGDGSIILPKGRKITSKTKKIHICIRGTKDFLSGIIQELNLEKVYLKTYDSTYRLIITDKIEVVKFFEVYKYQRFYLKRKHDRFLERL